MIEFESSSPTQAHACDLACARVIRKPQAVSGCCSSRSSARHGGCGRTSALLVFGASCCSINPALCSEHAGPARVSVRVWDSAQALHFAVRDTGCRFDPNGTPNGAGLNNMHDRIAAVCGIIAVGSTPSHGTLLHGSVPDPWADGAAGRRPPAFEPPAHRSRRSLGITRDLGTRRRVPRQRSSIRDDQQAASPEARDSKRQSQRMAIDQARRSEPTLLARCSHQRDRVAPSEVVAANPPLQRRSGTRPPARGSNHSPKHQKQAFPLVGRLVATSGEKTWPPGGCRKTLPGPSGDRTRRAYRSRLAGREGLGGGRSTVASGPSRTAGAPRPLGDPRRAVQNVESFASGTAHPRISTVGVLMRSRTAPAADAPALSMRGITGVSVTGPTAG